MLFEALEPRLLLSADPLTFVADTDDPLDVTLRLFDESGATLVELVDNASADRAVVYSAQLEDGESLRIAGSAHDDRVALEIDEHLDAAALSSHRFEFDGGDGNDTLLGSVGDTIWTISAANSGTMQTSVLDALLFTDVENLLGAANNEDTFVFVDGAALDGVADGGAGGFDSMDIIGGDFASVVFEATGPDSGSVQLDESLIAYAGLEPINFGANAGDIALVFGTLTLASDDNGVLGSETVGGETTFTFASGDATPTFEQVTFGDGFDSLRIDLGTGTDTLSIEAALSMPGNFSATAESVTLTDAGSITSTAGDISFTAAADVDTGLAAEIVIDGTLDADGDITLAATTDISGSQATLDDYSYDVSASISITAALSGDAISATADVLGTYSLLVEDASLLDDGDVQVTGTHAADVSVAGGVTVEATGAVTLAASDTTVVSTSFDPSEDSADLIAVTELDLSDASSAIDLTRAATATLGDASNGTVTVAGPGAADAGLVQLSASIAGGASGSIESDLYGEHVNTVDDTASASVTDAEIDATGVDVQASNTASYAATAKIAENAVTGATSASVSGSAISTSAAAGIGVGASDAATLDATSSEFQLDTGAITFPLELGSATAVNDFDRSVTASVSDASTLSATGGAVAVAASNEVELTALADAQILDDGGVQVDPIEVTLNGTIATNIVGGNVTASVEGGAVESDNGVSVTADNAPTIDARARTGSATGGVATGNGSGAFAWNAIGIEIANPSAASVGEGFGDVVIGFDQLVTSNGGDTRAFISNTTVSTGGDVDVAATSAPLVNSTVSNAASSTADPLYGAAGVASVAVSGSIAANRTNTSVQAYIERDSFSPTDGVSADGSISVRASDDASINSNSKLVSSSITSSDGGVNALSTFVAGLEDADFNTDGTIVTDAEGNDVTGPMTVEFGDKVFLTPDFDGDGSGGRVYEFAGSNRTLDLSTEDFTNLDLWKEQLETDLIPQGNNFLPSNSLSYGGVLVRNEIATDVEARITNTAVSTADGDVTVEASADADIVAIADTDATSSGGNVFGKGTSTANGGVVATNGILSSAVATIEGSTVDAGTAGGTATTGDLTVTASNTSTITASNSTAVSTGSESVGVMLSYNTIGYQSQDILSQGIDALIDAIAEVDPATVSATIVDSDLDVFGDVAVTADNAATLTARVDTRATSAAAAFFGADGVNVSFAIASNLVATDVEASVTNIDERGTAGAPPVAGGSVTIAASDAASIDATTSLEPEASETNTLGFSLVDEGVSTVLGDYQFTTESGTASMEFGDQVRIGENVADDDFLQAGDIFRYMGADGDVVTLDTTDYANFGLWQRVDEFNALGSIGKGVAKVVGLSGGTAKNRFGVVARNDVDARTEAFIDDSLVTAGSGIEVTATEMARITALDESTVTSVSNEAGSGSAGGVITNNQLLSRARAYVTDSELTTTGTDADITVAAYNLSVLDAQSLTSVSGATSIGIVAAFNSFGWNAANIFFNAFDTLLGTEIAIDERPVEAKAFIENSDVTATGDVSVHASTTQALFSLGDDFAQSLDDLSIVDRDEDGVPDPVDAAQDAGFLAELRTAFDTAGFAIGEDVELTLLATSSEWLVDDKSGSLYVVRRDGDSLDVALTSVLDVQVGNEVDSNVVNDRILADFLATDNAVTRNAKGQITDLKFGANGIAAGGVFASNRASAEVDAYIDTGTDFASSEIVGELEPGDRVALPDGSVYEYDGPEQRVDGAFTFASSSDPATISPADDDLGLPGDRVRLLEDTDSANAGEIYEYVGTDPLTVDFAGITADFSSDATPDTLEPGQTVRLATDVGGGTAGQVLRFVGNTLSNLFDLTSTATDADIVTGQRVQLAGTSEVYEYLGDDAENLDLSAEDYADDSRWTRVDFDLATQDYTTVDWQLVGLDLTAIDYSTGDWQRSNAPLEIDLSDATQDYENSDAWSLVGSNPTVSIVAGGDVRVGADDAVTLIAESQLDISSAVANNIDAVFNLINQAAIPNGYTYTTLSGEQTVEAGDTVRIDPDFLDENGEASGIAGRVFEYGAGDDPPDDLDTDLRTLTESDFEDDSLWTDITESATTENVVADFFPNVGNLANSSSRAMGGIIAFNDLRANADARIDDATVSADNDSSGAGDVAVTTRENATLLASVDSNVSSSGGSAFGTGDSIAYNGIIAGNVVLSEADAVIEDSAVSGVDVTVQAANTARMDATTNAQASTGDTAISAVLAFNTVGWKAQNILSSTVDAFVSGDPVASALSEGAETARVSARIVDSDVDATGDVTVDATSTAVINATTTNVNTSAAGALINAGGKSIGGLISTNKVNSLAEAYIDHSGAATSETVAADGSVTVTSSDNAGIYANNRLTSQSTTSNDGGAAVLQETLNDLIPADWRASNEPQEINLRFRDLVSVADDYDGDGDGEVDPTAGGLFVFLGDDMSDVDLATADYSDLDFWKPNFFASFFPQGNNITGSDSVAVGGLVVLNDLRSDVDAYIESATVTTTDGDVTVAATENATVNATVNSEVVSSGGSVFGEGTSLAINGSLATNSVLSDADAYIANSSVVASDTQATGTAGNVTVSAANTSSILALNESVTNTGDTGVGIVLAFNTVGWVPTNFLLQSIEALVGDPAVSTALDRNEPAAASAYIDASSVVADGALAVGADSAASIGATTSNETDSAAAAFVDASGIAVGGLLASSKVSSAVEAYITASTGITADAGVSVTASDDATIIADNVLRATSETVNSGGLNLLTNFLDQLAGEYNFTSNSGMRDIEAGDRVRLASDFAGAGGTAESLYLYQGAADLENVNLASNDYTGPGWVRFDVQDITSYIPDQLNFNVSSSNSIGIGGLIVFNDVRGDVDAYIEQSSVSANSGSVVVTASENATITARNESEAEADGGSVFTSGLSLAISGTVATNQVFADADARITSSNIGAADAAIGDAVTVSSTSNADITSTTDSALTVFGGGTSIAIGATLAFNRIGVPSYLLSTVDALFDGAIDDSLIEPASATASITGSNVYASNDVSTASTNASLIDANITNAAFASSISLGSSADTVVSIAPVLAFNRLESATGASIATSDFVRSDTGDIVVSATESADIDASIGITSASLALGTGQSVAVSFGFTFALNEIDSGVTATISDSQVVATLGDVLVSVDESASITATGVALSAAVAAGTGFTFGFSAAGAVALNEILGGANASIDSSSVSAENVTITADNAADIDALIAAASLAGSFSVGNDGVAGSIGLAVADNRIGFDYDDNRPDAGEDGTLDAFGVQAFSADSAIDASGDLVIAATSEALIDATIVAASAALAASTSGNAVAISAAGAASNNQIATRTRAYIDGDGAGVNARSIDIDASDESSIAALSGAASISGSVAGGNASGAISVGLGLALNEIDADVEAFIANADSGVSTATTFTESSGTQSVTAGDSVRLAADSALGEGGGVYEYTGADADLNLGAEDYTGPDWLRISADIAVTATTGDEPLFTLEGTGITLTRLGDAAIEDPDDESTAGPDERDIDLLEDSALLTELADAFAGAGVPLSGDPSAENRELTVYATGKGDDFALSDEGGNTFIISLDPLTGNLAVRGTSINAVAAAASVAASFGTGFSAGVTGAGAASTNEITGSTNAYIADSVVVSGEDVDLDATSTAVISSTVASASLAVSVGGSNGFGASLGGAVALNAIGATVTGDSNPLEVQAYIADASVTAGSDLDVDANSRQSISALVLSGSVALSAGASGSAAFSGAGVVTLNDVEIDTRAFIDGDGASGISASTITLDATDDSRILSFAGAVSAAGSADFTASGALSLAATVSDNVVRSETSAYIANADSGVASTFGDVIVDAESTGSILAASAAASLGGSVGLYGGVAISGAGAFSTNKILTSTNAYLDSSDVTSVANLTVTAASSAEIESVVLAIAAGVGVGGVGIAGALGLSLATNLIGFEDADTAGTAEVRAYVLDSDLDVAATLTVDALSTQAVDALVVAGAVGLALGGAAGAGAGSGAITTNQIELDVIAQIDGNGTDGIDADRIVVTATDDSTIDAFTGAASISAAVGLSFAGSLAIGVATATNAISSNVDASIENTTDLLTTGGDIVIAATSDASIDASSAAAAVAGSAGLSAALALAGAGATAENIITTSTRAFIADADVTSAANIEIDAIGSSSIDARILAVSVAASGGSLAGAGAIGVSLADNLIGYSDDDTRDAVVISAFVSDSEVSAAETLTIDASSTQAIVAEIEASSVALAAGIVAAGLNAAGVDALNRVAADVTAFVEGTAGAGVSADAIAITATDATDIDSNARTAALSGAVGAVSGTVSIGVSLAENRVDNLVQASIAEGANVSTTVGDIDITAIETATIDATSAASSTSTSFGIGSLALAGTGARAVNVIDNKTDAFISGSTTNSATATDVVAAGRSVINADIISASASNAGGLVAVGVSIGGAVAENTIGSSNGAARVSAYIEGSGVTTGTTLTVAALSDENAALPDTITARVDVDSTALAQGAVGGSGTGAGATANNLVNGRTQAYVGTASSTTTLNVGTDLLVDAGNIARSTADVGAVAFSQTVGAVSVDISVADSEADNEIRQQVSAYTTNADINVTGNMTVRAMEDADSVATATSASRTDGGAFSVGISGGGARANDDPSTSDATVTRAYVGAGSDVDVSGDVLVSATAESSATADASTGASSGSLISLANANTEATAVVTPDVFAYIGEGSGGTASVNAANVTIDALAGAEGDATAAASASGTVSVGGSGAVVNVNADVEGYIDRAANVVTTGDVTVNATMAPLTGDVPVSDQFQGSDVDLANDSIAFGFPVETGDVVQLGFNLFPLGGLESFRDYTVLVDSASGEVQFGAAFSGATVDADRDTITFEEPHGFVTGDTVSYDAGASTDPLFEDATVDTTGTFQVVVVDSTTVKLVVAGGDLEPTANAFTAADVDVDEDRITISGFAPTDGTPLTYRAPMVATFSANIVDVDLSGDEPVVDDTNGTVSITESNNNIFIPGHGFSADEEVVYETDGATLGGLTPGDTYRVQVNSTNSISLVDTATDEVVPIENSTDAFTEHSLRRTSEAPVQQDGGGTLVDGQTYYVFGFDDGDDSFQLVESLGSTTPVGLDLTVAQDGSTASHSLTTEALDLAASADTSEQSFVVDLTSAFDTTYRLTGAGGVLLAEISPPSRDGISSTSARGGGGFSGGNFDRPTADTTANFSALAWIAADATLDDLTGVVAGGNVTIASDSEGIATSSGNNSAGGFVQEGRVEVDTDYDNVSRAYVGKAAGGSGASINASGVEITADGLVTIDSRSTNEARANSYSDGAGFVGSAVATADLDLDSLTDSRVGAGADVEGTAVLINATGERSRADGAARGVAGGFYGYAAGRANVTHNSTVQVGLEGNDTTIRGNEGVDITVDQTDYSSREAGSRRCDCVISNGNTSDNNPSGSSATDINANTGVTVEVGARGDGTVLATSDELARLALYVDAQSTTDASSINWNSDVLFLRGGQDLLLRVDAAGNVVEQENIEDDEFSSSATQLVVNNLDANEDHTGQALFTGDDDVVVTGTAATFIYANTWDSVTLIAEGDQQIFINDITPYNDGTNPPDDDGQGNTQEDVRIDVVSDVLFSFAVEQRFDATLIDIQSLGDGVPTGDESPIAVVFDGVIDNPIGTTSVTTVNGNVSSRYLDGDFGTIRTNILTMDVNGDIGAEFEFIEANRPPEIELVNSEDRPTDIDVTATGYIELDIRGIQREDTTEPLLITGSNISAGGDVDLRLFEGLDQTELPEGLPAFTIEVVETDKVTNPSDLPPGSVDHPDGRSTEVSDRFRPLIVPLSPVDLPVGVFGTGSTEIVVTYDIGLIQSGGDIDILGAGGDVPGPINVEDNIEVPDTTIHLVAGTNIVSTAADPTLGNIDVDTNGDVTLTETSDDLRIGLITTQGDVNLTSVNGSIIDAPDDGDTDAGDAAADVVADSFVFTSTLGGIGTASNVLQIDSATETDGTLTATADDHIFITKLSGNMNIERVITDTNVTLVTDDGSILDASIDEITDVQGDFITLDANGGGIGEFTLVDGDPTRSAVETNLVDGVGDLFADFNDDGFVNAIDAGIFINNFGTTNALTDLNRDGFVNAIDAGLFIDNFGTSRPEADGVVGLVANATNSILIAETEGTLFVEEVVSSEGAVTLEVIDSAADDDDLVLAVDGVPGRIEANFNILLDVGDDIEIPEGALLSAGINITISVDGSDENPDADVGVGSTVELAGSLEDFSGTVNIGGGDDEDTFDFTFVEPFPAFTFVSVSGGDPSDTTPGDTLIVRNDGAVDSPSTTPAGSGDITIPGIGDLSYFGIETVVTPAPLVLPITLAPLRTASAESFTFDADSGRLEPLSSAPGGTASQHALPAPTEDWVTDNDEAAPVRRSGLIQW